MSSLPLRCDLVTSQISSNSLHPMYSRMSSTICMDSPIQRFLLTYTVLSEKTSSCMTFLDLTAKAFKSTFMIALPVQRYLVPTPSTKVGGGGG